MSETSLHKKLQNDIGYQFENQKFLIEALSHPSMKQIDKNMKIYERYEFLGDSIVGFLIAEHLFKQYEDKNEGQLAKMKAYLVSKEVLSEIGTKLNIHNCLIMTDGEVKSGGRENKNNIENALESLIAAVYLDNGILTVKKLILKLWKCYFVDFDSSFIDPKSFLQEAVQKKGLDVPSYNLVTRSGAAHDLNFIVEVTIDTNSTTGEGKSLKEAEKSAARKMIKFLGYE